MWSKLLPKTDDHLTRSRAALISVTSLGLAAAVLFIIGYWILSGSLEDWETLVAGAVFILILAGIATLARSGRVALAAWLLVSLLTLLIAADCVEYGIGSPSTAGFVIPIVLAACALGFWPGLGVAAASVTVVWIGAWSTTTGLYGPPADISHLTFNAPALTAIFLLTALIVGFWSRSLTKG